jgi:hypothetical protein
VGCRDEDVIGTHDRDATSARSAGAASIRLLDAERCAGRGGGMAYADASKASVPRGMRVRIPLPAQ